MLRRLSLLLALAFVIGSVAPEAAFAAQSGNGRGRHQTVTPADLALPVAASQRQSVVGWYIVQTKPSAGDPGQVAKTLARKYNLTLKNVYRTALTGFTAKVPDGKIAALQADPAVVSTEPDRQIQLIAPAKKSIGPVQTASNAGPQVTPFGIDRIQAPENDVFQAQKVAGVNANVAVIDTGIWKDHPDLNVAGGYNCSSSNPGDTTNFNDGFGHGTHVSGTIGAKDNDFGVIGVAPGAALFGVKVLNDSGVGATSDVICGLEWVVDHADEIDVANMSLGGPASPKQPKGCALNSGAGAEERAICDVVAADVPVIVAAGNNCVNANQFSPAQYEATIAVGAFADDDGKPGGLGGPAQRAPACPKPNVRVPDDSMTPFTNYGSVVDIWAPGDGVLSTVPPANIAVLGNDAEYDSLGWSGTSMATPHVTGSAALFIAGYKAAHGGSRPTVDAVRSALLTPGGAGHPGAESAVIKNARFGKPGSKKMPRKVNALIVNDNSAGPWTAAAGRHSGKAGGGSKHRRGTA